MLAGLGAVLLPLVLHVAGRARQDHVFWPAIDFVDDTPRQAHRWRSVRRWLLLAARMLAIGFMALAMAGVVWRPEARQVIVLVDTSGSMVTGDGGLVSGGAGTMVESTRLQASLRLGGGVLADVLPGDRMMVMTTAQTGDPHFHPTWTTDPSSAASQLAGIRQGAHKSDLAEAMQQAARHAMVGQTDVTPAANATGLSTVIWLITDRQEVSWQSLPASRGQWQQLRDGRSLTVRVVLVGDELPVATDAAPAMVEPSDEDQARQLSPSSAPTPPDAQRPRVMREELAHRSVRRFALPDTGRGDRVRLIDPSGHVSLHVAGAGGSLTVGPLVGLGDYEVVSVTGQTLLRIRVPPPLEELSPRQLTDDEIRQLLEGFEGVEIYPGSAWYGGQLPDQARRWLAGDVMGRGLWLMAGVCIVASWALNGSASGGRAGRGRPSRGAGWLWLLRGGIAVAVLVVAAGSDLSARRSDATASTSGSSSSPSINGRRVWIDPGTSMLLPLSPGSSVADAGSADAVALFDSAVQLGRIEPPAQWREVTRQLARLGALAAQARSLEYSAARSRYARAMGARTAGLTDLLARAQQWQARLDQATSGPPNTQSDWEARAWVRHVGRGTSSAGVSSAVDGQTAVIGPAAVLADRAGQLHQRRQTLVAAELAGNPRSAAAVAELAAMSREAFADALSTSLELQRVASPRAADLIISDGVRPPVRAEAVSAQPASVALPAVLLVGGQIDDAAITGSWLTDLNTDLAGDGQADTLPAVSRTLWPEEALSVVLQVRQEGRARVSAVRVSYQGQTIDRPLTFEGERTTIVIPLPGLTTAPAAVPLFATQASDRRVRISLTTTAEAVLPVARENNTALVIARVWPVRLSIQTHPAGAPSPVARVLESLDDSFVVRRVQSSGRPAGVLLLSTKVDPEGEHATTTSAAASPTPSPVPSPAPATAITAWLAGGGGVVALMSDMTPASGQTFPTGVWARTSPTAEVPLVSSWRVLPWSALSLTGDYFSLPPASPHATSAEVLLADDRGRPIIARWPAATVGQAPPLLAVGLGELANWTAPERASLWKSIVRTAAGRAMSAEASGVAIEAPASIGVGQTAEVLVRLRRSDGSPEVATSVAPLVLRVDGRVVRQLPLVRTSPGWYTASLDSLSPDQYTLHFGGDLSPSVPLNVLRPRLARVSADRPALATAFGIDPAEVVDVAQLYRLSPAVHRAAAGRLSAAMWYRHPLVFLILLMMLGTESWLAGRRGGTD
jgi:hypothetical protein